MKNILSKIEIDISTYLLILLAIFAGYIKYVCIILTIVAFHELGHIITIKIFNYNIINIKLYPFGGLTNIYKRIHERIYKEIIISISGILFQIILIYIFKKLYIYEIITISTYNIFQKYNSVILIFNIIPIIPLDGSKVLNAIFNKFISFKKSYILSIIISFISLLFLIIYSYNMRFNNLLIYTFLLYKIYLSIKEYKYIENKFYLERILYNNYYNKIINNCQNINNLRIDKYYFFKKNNKFINEKEYIKKERY